MTYSVQNKQNILIVDDRSENISLLNEILSDDYNIIAALNGKKALEVASHTPQPDLILLDILMPDLDGYEVCRQLKVNQSTKNIPVIFVTALHNEVDENKGFRLGGVDFISKPVKPAIVKARIKTHLALFNQSRALEDQVRERTSTLEINRLGLLRGLNQIVAYTVDNRSFQIMRIKHYAYKIAEAMKMSLSQCDLIYNATPLFDIGMIAVPEHILLKAGALTDDERLIIESHCEKGSEILANLEETPLLKIARTLALYHHEKYDGTGYPFGLSGDEIPIESRIVTLANVFDALTSERPYKDISTNEQALTIIKNESGHHFDPEVVAAFVAQWPEIIKIKARLPDIKSVLH